MEMPTLSEIYGTAISTGLSLLFLVIVFRPMEKVFPAKPEQKFFRPDWWTDLFFFLGQYLFFSGAVLWVLTHATVWLDAYIPSGFREVVRSQPVWLQAIEVVLLSDFFIYWAHRLQHAVPFLWRFHSVHHTAEHLDWLAAHREHPLDSIYTIGIINLPAFLLGFPLETIAGLIAFNNLIGHHLCWIRLKRYVNNIATPADNPKTCDFIWVFTGPMK